MQLAVFPKATNLQCQFHNNMDFAKAWKFVMDAWASMMDCGDRDAFVKSVKRFEVV